MTQKMVYWKIQNYFSVDTKCPMRNNNFITWGCFHCEHNYTKTQTDKNIVVLYIWKILPQAAFFKLNSIPILP